MAKKTLVQLFDALSDDTRLKIVLILSRHDVDASCQALSRQFKLSQPAMSHHFKILRESKLVKVRKDGRKVYYSLNRKRLGNYLQKFMRDIQIDT